MKKDESLLVTQPQAARLLGISVATIKRMISEGQLETVYIRPTAHPRLRARDIEALVGQAKAAVP